MLNWRYIKIQSVPRSKHPVSVIQTSQLMLYREIIAVCSEIHTKHINSLCGQNVELLNVKLVVHIVTTGYERINCHSSQTNAALFTLAPDRPHLTSRHSLTHVRSVPVLTRSNALKLQDKVLLSTWPPTVEGLNCLPTQPHLHPPTHTHTHPHTHTHTALVTIYRTGVKGVRHLTEPSSLTNLLQWRLTI